MVSFGKRFCFWRNHVSLTGSKSHIQLSLRDLRWCQGLEMRLRRLVPLVPWQEFRRGANLCSGCGRVFWTTQYANTDSARAVADSQPVDSGLSSCMYRPLESM